MAGAVTAVVLAAGYSSRMGEFKPLLPLGEVTVLERVVTLFHDAGISDVRVVTGHREADLKPRLERLGARAVANPDYRDGMFSSVAAGVATVGAEVEAFFVLPVDVPLIRPETVRRLIDAYLNNRADVVYPRVLGQRGHPPLIAGHHAPEIAKWQGAGGLRAVLARWDAGALDVAVADEYILRDMDTPDDYRLLLERADRSAIPTEAECMALLRTVLQVDERIVHHGQAVARVAVLLGDALNRAGCSLDIPLLAAAGLLHDLARQEPDHARAGAHILRQWGFDPVAGLVASHMDLVVNERKPVHAREVLYLADKLVRGERVVSLAERFRPMLERHTHEPSVIRSIAGRLRTARTVRKRLENVLGFPLEKLITLHE